MARLYADEQFPRPVVEVLRQLGHDVLTVQETEQTGAADSDVLAFAIAQQRVVVTLNRRDFVALHQMKPDHTGIMVCSEDRDFVGLAERINRAIAGVDGLQGMLIRVRRSG
jgi:hypothetical protein